MLHIWDAVEADFLRDYGIRLVEQLDQMTWRLFKVLMDNLSPNGAVAVRIRALNDHPEEDAGDDEAAANDFFASVMSI